MIGEILTAFDLAEIQRESAKNFSQRAYVAPSVYRLASANGITGWKFYSTLEAAIKQWQYLTGQGGSQQTAAGTISFASAATAQTLGNNVDFYYWVPPFGWIAVPYAALKKYYSRSIIMPIKFYKTDGSGPYYAVLNNSSLGIAATVLENVPASKIAALDSFHREVQLLKSKYNTLAFYLNTLAKKNLNSFEQRSFNEGLLLLNRMENELRSISGIQINFDSSGRISGIGVLPVLAIIAILITAGATAWTIDRITTERNKTARINSSYDMVKWANDQKLKISQAVTAGTLSASEAAQLQSELNAAAANAQQVVSASMANTPGIMDRVETLAFIGLGIYALSVYAKTKTNG